MKLKLLATAVAALGSASAFAAPLDNTTTPEVIYYIAGASAQAQAFNTIAKSLFTTPADVVQITASAPCADTGDANKHVAYYGMRNSKRTLLVYRNKDGSGAGVQQLLATATTAPAVTSGGVVINKLTSAVAGSAGSYTGTSNSCVATLPVGAMSDVRTTELADSVLSVAGSTGYGAVSSIKTPIKTGLQGFGIAVSYPLYKVLQDQNIAEGKLDASCDDSDANRLLGTCQPSVRKADYASLAAAAGAIKDLDGFTNGTSTAQLTLARRVDLSGTQASSGIYFLNAKTPGALDPATAADFPVADIATNGFAVEELSSSGTLKGSSYLASTTKAVIGILSLENTPATTADTWKWVKIDGVSPNYAFDAGTGALALDPYQRQTMASGDYDFAMESYLLYKDSALNTGTGIIKAIADNIKLTANSNLVGYAYINAPGTWAAWDSTAGYTGNTNKQAKASRGGSNLKPFME